jgi:hypothetical protein
MGKMDFVFIKDSMNRTPEGYLKVKARAARTGIQTYVKNNKVVRVLRTQDEVFNPESLASLKNKPITVGHPKEFVNINNIKTYSMGFTTEYLQQVKDGEDIFIETELMVQDLNTIDKIETGQLTEISAGYQARYEANLNTNDNTYDEVQKNIVYNHIALLPTGTARAGRKARIQLTNDSLEMVYDSLDDEIIITKEVKKKMGKIKVSGIEFEVEDTLEQALKNQLTLDSNTLIEKVKEVELKEKKIQELEGKVLVLDSEIKSKPDLTSEIKTRLAFYDKAKALVTDSNLVSIEMDSNELMKAVIKDRMPTLVLDSVSTDFLNGVFSTLTPIVTTNTQATKVIDSLGEDGKTKAIVSPRSKFLNNFGKKGE